MKLLPPLLAAVLLSGCVTVPIPPFGNEEQRGGLGALRVSVSVQYIPKTTTTPATASQAHAWEQFLKTKPKLLKDK